MFDIAPTELLLCAVVALVVIGPKDLPRAMRTVGQLVARVRGVARQFRSGFDEMVRQAELEEMEKTWAEENARIMREHPPEEAYDAAYARGEHDVHPDMAEPARAIATGPGLPPLAEPHPSAHPPAGQSAATEAAVTPHPLAAAAEVAPTPPAAPPTETRP